MKFLSLHSILLIGSQINDSIASLNQTTIPTTSIEELTNLQEQLSNNLSNDLFSLDSMIKQVLTTPNQSQYILCMMLVFFIQFIKLFFGPVLTSIINIFYKTTSKLLQPYVKNMNFTLPSLPTRSVLPIDLDLENEGEESHSVKSFVDDQKATKGNKLDVERLKQRGYQKYRYVSSSFIDRNHLLVSGNLEDLRTQQRNQQKLNKIQNTNLQHDEDVELNNELDQTKEEQEDKNNKKKKVLFSSKKKRDVNNIINTNKRNYLNEEEDNDDDVDVKNQDNVEDEDNDDDDDEEDDEEDDIYTKINSKKSSSFFSFGS